MEIEFKMISQSETWKKVSLDGKWEMAKRLNDDGKPYYWLYNTFVSEGVCTETEEELLDKFKEKLRRNIKKQTDLLDSL